MQDRPTVDELLEAVQSFLRDDVMAATSGRVNFHARVAGNVLEWVRRELANEQPHLQHEWDGLNRLDGINRPLPAGLPAARAAIEERNQELCARIRAGAFAEGSARIDLLAHLRAVTHDKLVVTNPALLPADSNPRQN
jgi:hypothetical protein